jgi:hypothetical protein
MRKRITSKKSPLLEQAERLFRSQEDTTFGALPEESHPLYGELRFVDSVTTYSACEDPIPNPYKQQ